MAASAATQTPKPEQFDLTIDDDMHVAHDGTSKVLAEQEQAVLERKIAVAEIVAHHLGPSSTTADQACVARLTELGRAGRPRRRKGEDMPMEVSNNDQQQPPPPPPGGTPLIIYGGKAKKPIEIKTKIRAAPPRARGRSRNPHDEMAIVPGAPPPGPPPPPARMMGESSKQMLNL